MADEQNLGNQDQGGESDRRHDPDQEKSRTPMPGATPVRAKKKAAKSSGEFADPEDERSMEELHRAAMEREEQLPEEGNERGPWWMYAIIIATLAFGFFYMGRYLGEISDRPHVLFTTPVPADVAPEELDLMATGRRVYARLCQSCHQQDGAGVPGAFPPLGGSDWVVGAPERPVHIVLQGFQGEIVRNGVTYNAVMPGFGRLLSDDEVASVVTYIRNSFGNEAPEVAPEGVAEMREASAGYTEPWTEAALDEFIGK
jgi:mono/diheme cytochrome c family protein